VHCIPPPYTTRVPPIHGPSTFLFGFAWRGHRSSIHDNQAGCITPSINNTMCSRPSHGLIYKAYPVALALPSGLGRPASTTTSSTESHSASRHMSLLP